MIDKKRIADFFLENFSDVPVVVLCVDKENRIHSVSNIVFSDKLELLEKYLDAASEEEISFNGVIK